MKVVKATDNAPCTWQTHILVSLFRIFYMLPDERQSQLDMTTKKEKSLHQSGLETRSYNPQSLY